MNFIATLASRIQHTHDTSENWEANQLDTKFIPEKGEFIVYDVDDNHASPRLKIGDGSTNLQQLPFFGETTSNGESGSYSKVSLDVVTDVPTYEYTSPELTVTTESLQSGDSKVLKISLTSGELKKTSDVKTTNIEYLT